MKNFNEYVLKSNFDVILMQFVLECLLLSPVSLARHLLRSTGGGTQILSPATVSTPRRPPWSPLGSVERSRGALAEQTCDQDETALLAKTKPSLAKLCKAMQSYAKLCKAMQSYAKNSFCMIHLKSKRFLQPCEASLHSPRLQERQGAAKHKTLQVLKAP